MDEASRKYVTINTQKGLHQYTRLPFGVASAPSIFQKTMDNILQDIEKVCVYLDDILITGATEVEHLHNVQKVLSCLEQAGMHLKKDKCAFLLPQVEYLGHQISQKGLHPTKDKVRAIVEAPAPCNVTQLKSFLGMLNYYNKLLPNLSTLLAPLYSLLHERTEWQWGTAQQTAFSRAKELLAFSQVLVHFDQTKPLVLSCDASPYGIGAVLSHNLLSRVHKLVLQGWRATDDLAMNPFQQRKDELSIQDNCILWGSCIVIPPPGHPKIIDELRAGHPGISRMKSLARSYVWWPGMDADIESKVRNCHQCQQNQKSPTPVPMKA